ncbi:MAG TPA: hypothetical protein VGR98_20800, partial [Streptosporangiaceae bacterium]|nr:hypothetical protein [Streptosporangiaceae bacterium]
SGGRAISAVPTRSSPSQARTSPNVFTGFMALMLFDIDVDKQAASAGQAVQRLESRMHLEPWAPGARDVYVRIVPAQITGRRIQSS